MRFEPAEAVVVLDDATHEFVRGIVIQIRADKAFEYNNGGGAVYFPLLANVNYEIESFTNVVVHAPSGGGTVTFTVQVGES